MTDSRLDQIRGEGDRLGFDVSDELLNRCLENAAKLGETAGALNAGTDVDVTTSPDVTPSGEHSEFLAVYDPPRQEHDTGPLTGMRVAIKDNIATGGLPLTCGSTRVAVTPEIDAAVTERLLEAGAHLVGKTNMDSFAFGPSGEFTDYGRVMNPVDPDRVPGGSSSGSGAAVAAGTADLALGTDTGGSVRIPAACCGIVGTKPTHSVVPRHGFVSFAPSLDTIGPLARDVETAARALKVISGPDPRDPTAHERPLIDPDDWQSLGEDATVGLPAEFFARCDSGVADSVRAAVEESDLRTKPVELPLGQIEQAYFLIGAAEFVWYLDQTGVVRGQGPEYTPAVRKLLSTIKSVDLGDHVAERLLGAAVLDTRTDGEAYRAARQEAIAFTQRVDKALSTVDALVMPTIRTLPPEWGQMESIEDMLTLLGNTAPFNIARTPATTVPIDNPQGLPISAQVVGPRFGDLTTLTIAEQLHEET